MHLTVFLRKWEKLLKFARKKLTWKSKRTVNLERQEKNEMVAKTVAHHLLRDSWP